MFNKEEIGSNIRGVYRSYPLMFMIISLILGSVFKLNVLLYLVALIIGSSFVNNRLLKSLLYKLSEIAHLESITLRPTMCKNSSNFINEFSPNKLSESYGMPSGHSVESMLIGVFLTLYILKTHDKSTKRTVLVCTIIAISLSVCISRVYFGCHTVLQILVGGIFGSLVGYLGFKLWESKFAGDTVLVEQGHNSP